MNIQGQAALVTGGASGLGEATARELALMPHDWSQSGPSWRPCRGSGRSWARRIIEGRP